MSCKVSVSVTTYNHEQFIDQAIESILMQELDFEYEIIIGEDDSSDRTREIVQVYKKKHPQKITLFLNDRSNVIYINGRPTGRWNFVNNLKHAQGEYVALLEGDDYWSSPDKLQSQVDFLDSHPDCTVCCHPVTECYEDENQEMRFSDPFLPNEIYTIEHLLERNFISTCSVMFRNQLFGQFPDWYYTVVMGDWPLHILNAQHGNIGYIDQVMAVRRVHSGGMWSPKNVSIKQKNKVATLKTIKQQLGPKYNQKLDDSIARWHLKVIRALEREKDYGAIGSYVADTLLRERVPAKSWAKAVIWAFNRATGRVKW